MALSPDEVHVHCTCYLASKTVSPVIRRMVAHTETKLIDNANVHSSKSLLRPRLVAMYSQSGAGYITLIPW